MRKILFNLVQKIKTSNEKSTLQQKLFDELLLIIMFVSIANIIGNLIISFPFNANYKWAFLIVFTFIINYYKNTYSWVRFFYFLFVIVVISPLGWYQSGANNNNVIGYIFLIVIAITFIFTGKKRLFLVCLITLLFISFTLLEYYFPELLPTYDKQIQLSDRLIQVPMALFVSYAMLRQFSNSYNKNSHYLREVNEKLEVIAYTDALTELYNRGFIIQKLEESIDNKINFSTILIDIDNFKDINDNLGHLTGDQVLFDLALLLKKHFEPYGFVARYGGDEFIVLLFLELSTVNNKINELVQDFDKYNKLYNTKPTLSGGYGAFKHNDLDHHLRSIDEALYIAKNQGKNAFVSI